MQVSVHTVGGLRLTSSRSSSSAKHGVTSGVLSERRVVFLVGAVQFINVLDFTMVMPLGPDFARALAIAPSELGKIVSGYGQAAAVTGFLGSFFLDRFDRRKVLAVAMFGLMLGTLAGGLARDLA